MPNTELPIDLETQVVLMKKYVSFRQRKKMRDFLGDAGFYLDKQYYTPTKSEKDKKTRNRNVAFFHTKFFAGLINDEEKLRTDTELQSNGIKVFLLQGQVFKNEKLIDLTAAEYKLLCLFMRNPNRERNTILCFGSILLFDDKAADVTRTRYNNRKKI